MRGARVGRPTGQSHDNRDSRDDPCRATSGAYRSHDGETHRRADRPPGQIEPVDAVTDAGLEMRGVGEPESEPAHCADQRGDGAHDGAVRDHDEPDVAISCPECAHHAERT
jgi:hypothetical protein